MKFMPASEKTWLTTSRIETLADGIFAISMTLLVLGLTIPPAKGGNPDEILRGYLHDDWRDLFNFIKSFLLLAIFWIIHHRQFHSLRRADENFLWLNIFFLMFIVLVPFSTTVESEYSNIQLAVLIFHTNLLAIGICSYLITAYAMVGHRLISMDVSQLQISRARKRSMVVPGTALLAIGISFISPTWSSLAYLLIPLIIRRIGR
jgi:uncharacterized membrane protein